MAFSAETRNMIKAAAGNKCEMCGRSNDDYWCDCSHNNHSRTDIDPHTGQTFYDDPNNGQLLCLDHHLEISDNEWDKQAIQGRIRRQTIYRRKITT